MGFYGITTRKGFPLSTPPITGADVLERRKAMGASQAILARYLGISVRTLFKIEKESNVLIASPALAQAFDELIADDIRDFSALIVPSVSGKDARRARRFVGATQAEFSKYLGVSRNTIAEIEKNSNRPIQKHAIRIAVSRVLRLNLAEVIDLGVYEKPLVPYTSPKAISAA